jgi:hypothetical protein
MPVLPKVTVSAALKAVVEASRSVAPPNALEPSNKAPAPPAARAKNSRRFMGPPHKRKIEVRLFRGRFSVLSLNSISEKFPLQERITPPRDGGSSHETGSTGAAEG